MRTWRIAAVFVAAALFAVCAVQGAKLPLRPVAGVPLTGRAISEPAHGRRRVPAGQAEIRRGGLREVKP